MAKQKQNAPQRSPEIRKKIITRIAVTGFIGVAFFIGLNWYVYGSTYTVVEALLQTAIFLGVWWGVQVLLNYRLFFPKDL